MKNILVSQPNPVSLEKSPFCELIEKYKVKIDFTPFIKVEAISAKEFRTQRVDILAHTAVIFTSRGNIDNFFKICEENRTVITDDMKYFCTTEAIALYLQKHIVYRKRKVFFGKGRFSDLMDIIVKHKEEKYLLAMSEPHNPEMRISLDKAKIKYSKIILSHTVSRDIKDSVDISKYDIVVFYSAPEINSLVANFPDIKEKDIVIATFGTATASTAVKLGIKVSILASTKTFPSMITALADYIQKVAKSQPIDTSYIKEAIDAEKALKDLLLSKIKGAKKKKPTARAVAAAAAKKSVAKQKAL